MNHYTTKINYKLNNFITPSTPFKYKMMNVTIFTISVIPKSQFYGSLELSNYINLTHLINFLCNCMGIKDKKIKLILHQITFIIHIFLDNTNLKKVLTLAP